MNSVLINIDVPDLDQAMLFYQSAFSLTVKRRFQFGVELIGLSSPIYLLKKEQGSIPYKNANARRNYSRHWCPIHLDFVVNNIEETIKNLLQAGAEVETPVETSSWGKIAMFHDPFGHGLCVIEFSDAGYDALLHN